MNIPNGTTRRQTNSPTPLKSAADTWLQRDAETLLIPLTTPARDRQHALMDHLGEYLPAMPNGKKGKPGTRRATAIQVLQKVFELAPDIDPTKPKRWAIAGARTIAVKAGLSEASTQRALEALESVCIMTVIRPGDPQWPTELGQEGCLRAPAWPNLDELFRAVKPQREFPYFPAVAAPFEACSPRERSSGQSAPRVTEALSPRERSTPEGREENEEPLYIDPTTIHPTPEPPEWSASPQIPPRENVNAQTLPKKVDRVQSTADHIKLDTMHIRQTLDDVSKQLNSRPASRRSGSQGPEWDRCRELLALANVGAAEPCLNATNWPAPKIIEFLEKCKTLAEAAAGAWPFDPRLIYTHLTTMTPGFWPPESEFSTPYTAAIKGAKSRQAPAASPWWEQRAPELQALPETDLREIMAVALSKNPGIRRDSPYVLMGAIREMDRRNAIKRGTDAPETSK